MRVKRGNILPFAVIMTVMILLAGIGIASVVLQGVQRAKSTDQSIGAYYMADSGIERQLFELRKNDQTLAYVNTLDQTTPPTYPGGLSWKSTGALETPISKTITTVATTSFATLDLFNPDNLSAKPNIGAVTVTWGNGSCSPALPAKLEASYAYWDLSGPTPQWPLDNQYVILPKTNAGSLDITPLDPNKAYRLRLKFSDCAATNVVIKTYASDGITPQPFPGDITLAAEGTFGQATQKIAATMPKQDVLSGLFGYVIFSECTLYKGPGAPPACP